MQKFLENWMLPLAISLGSAAYLVLYNVPYLAENFEPGVSAFAKNVQPWLIAVMLFLQFNRISPHDLRFRRWHFVALGFQILIFIALAVVAFAVPDGNARVLVESAMLCFICPTAAAAGVITHKLGGKLSDTVSYVVLINVAVTVAIPLVIPVFNPSSGVSFLSGLVAISLKIFPLLVLPLLLAWLVRYTAGGLQRWLMRYTGWAFYAWGISLTLAIFLATRALVQSHISFWIVVLIGVISLVCTLVQFAVGRAAGALSRKRHPDCADVDILTAGQALGQKNTGFLIWLGYSYFTPVTSVAGGLYSIWQNIINSRELYEKNHRK